MGVSIRGTAYTAYSAATRTAGVVNDGVYYSTAGCGLGELPRFGANVYSETTIEFQGVSGQGQVRDFPFGPAEHEIDLIFVGQEDAMMQAAAALLDALKDNARYTIVIGKTFNGCKLDGARSGAIGLRHVPGKSEYCYRYAFTQRGDDNGGGVGGGDPGYY